MSTHDPFALPPDADLLAEATEAAKRGDLKRGPVPEFVLMNLRGAIHRSKSLRRRGRAPVLISMELAEAIAFLLTEEIEREEGQQRKASDSPE